MKEFLLPIVVIGFVAAGVLYVGYNLGARSERSESVELSDLIAKADSNIVFMEKVLADTTKRPQHNQASANLFYWRGAKDAFLSLDESDVRVKRSVLRSQ